MQEEIIRLMQTLAPDLAAELIQRAVVLERIASMAPVGRRQLAARLHMTEREARACANTLREHGFISLDPAGMTLTEKAKELLRIFDLEEERNSLACNLPYGKQRKLEIARALATNPKLLLLDEPAAGLDPKGRDRILGMVQELHQEGVTVVMVSHSMDDCARLATRMIVMSKGEVVASDTPRALFSNPELMTSVHLGVPEAARLCMQLREKGVDLPHDLYTQEELHTHLLRLWKEADHT